MATTTARMPFSHQVSRCSQSIGASGWARWRSSLTRAFRKTSVRRRSTQVFSRISYPAGHRAGGDRKRRGQEDLRFLVAHTAREIPIRGADALQWRVHAAESVNRPPQAGSAAGVFGHLHASLDEDLPNRPVSPTGRLQVVNRFGGGRDAEGVDGHVPPAQDAREFQKVAGLASRAGSDVGPVELDVSKITGLLALAGVGMTSHGRFESLQIQRHLVNKLLVLVAHDRFVGRPGPDQACTVIHIYFTLRVDLENPVLAASLDG